MELDDPRRELCKVCGQSGFHHPVKEPGGVNGLTWEPHEFVAEKPKRVRKKKAEYEGVVEQINAGTATLPEWATGKDALGRSKAIYLASRFNGMKSGVYAKEVQKQALHCSSCVVRTKCPLFEEGSLCKFIPMWRKLGAKTRNTEQITRTMQHVVAEKIVRYKRAVLMEALKGGDTDEAVSALENDVVKSLEVLNWVMNPGTGTTRVALEMGKNGVKLGIEHSTDEVLESLRAEYGPDLIKRIKRWQAPAIEAEVIEPVESERSGGDAKEA
jgi:hypothetical protein